MEDRAKNNETLPRSRTDEVMELVVRAAIEYLVKALKTTETQIRPKSLRIEEISGNAESVQWSLTLSYIDAATDNPLSVLYGSSSSDRIYKDFLVAHDGENYSVTSMKDRVGR